MNPLGYFQFHKHLDRKEWDRLLDSLIYWTGGAPRPLSHLMEKLLHSHGDLFTSQEGLKQVFSTIAGVYH